MGIRCENCSSTSTQVLATRTFNKYMNVIWRHRRCRICKKKFYTEEYITTYTECEMKMLDQGDEINEESRFD